MRPRLWHAGWLLVAVLLLSAAAQVPPRKEKFAPAPGESVVRLLRKDAKAGLELWQTRLGPLWAPPGGGELLPFLQWEQTVQKCYTHPIAHVRPGDVVLDCGAHIGVFTRVALELGARLVLAIEPEEKNRAAFQRNFAAELKAGRVRLVPLGVWDSEGHLNLRLSTVNSGSHSLVFDSNISGEETIPVTTIDKLVEAQKLTRVDFIKMDIEGSEQHALRGGVATIARWRPRLAISSYHLHGDPAAIAAIVWGARPDYRIAVKDLELPAHGTVVPKVLFFY